MTVLNKLGYCVSYFSMHRERLRIEEEEESKSNCEKVVCTFLQKFAWDNIDAHLVANVTRLLGKLLDWRGTIFISEQMRTTTPIVTDPKVPKNQSPRLSFCAACHLYRCTGHSRSETIQHNDCRARFRVSGQFNISKPQRASLT